MISLIITSQGRKYHLNRLLEGVTKNTKIPDEIIIVSNDSDRSELPLDLNIKVIQSPFDGFPIGKNRNLGAKSASFNNLFFLDVDCIPDETFFDTLNADYTQFGGLCMGNPHYLKHKVPAGFSYKELYKDAIPHPHRPKITAAKKEEDYAIFWTLCFAIARRDFDKIGGFDTQFTGYGAEDTDFGFTAKEVGLPFYLSTAIAFHQQHPIYRPPVNHIQDIVQNSNVFYQKWNKWPMGGWLNEFKDKGWIRWNENSSKPIEIIELPSNEVIESYKVKDARFV